jgi:hypothetical protein
MQRGGEGVQRDAQKGFRERVVAIKAHRLHKPDCIHLQHACMPELHYRRHLMQVERAMNFPLPELHYECTATSELHCEPSTATSAAGADA